VAAPPPQQAYPQPQYPQAQYPQAPQPHRPVRPSGVAITAMILCTLASLWQIWGDIVLFSALDGIFGAPWWIIASNVVGTIGDVILIAGTILMWRRRPLGRILAVIGLGVALVTVFGVRLMALSEDVSFEWSSLTYLYLTLTVLSLAFVLLPSTGRYLKGGRDRVLA
jgi:hypothetical protein